MNLLKAHKNSYYYTINYNKKSIGFTNNGD